VFGWANQDGFWKSNILSPAKLREKFSQLKIQMEGKKDGNKRRDGFRCGEGQRYGGGSGRPGEL
jgi:hypothetical protein